VFFYLLYIGSKEPVPRERAVVFFRFAVLIVLATINIVVFRRVVLGVMALF
jgi:hypothetical protein